MIAIFVLLWLYWLQPQNLGQECNHSAQCKAGVCCRVGGAEKGKKICALADQCDAAWCYKYKISGLDDPAFDGVYQDFGKLINGAPVYVNSVKDTYLYRADPNIRASLCIANGKECVYPQEGTSALPEKITFNGGKRLECLR